MDKPKSKDILPGRIDPVSTGTLKFTDEQGDETIDQVELLPGGHFRSVDGRRRYVRRSERLYRNLIPGPSSFPYVGVFVSYRPKA